MRPARLNMSVPSSQPNCCRFKCEPTIQQDDADTQSNLGAMYAEGQCVPQDNVAAHMWFSFATTFATHSEVRDAITKLRDFLLLLMSPAQIAEA